MILLLRIFINFISAMFFASWMWMTFLIPHKSMGQTHQYLPTTMSTKPSGAVNSLSANQKTFSVALGLGGSTRAEEDWNGYLETSKYANGFLALGYKQNHWFRMEMASARFETGNETVQLESDKRNYSIWYAYETDPLKKWLLAYFEGGVGVSQQRVRTKLYDEVSTDQGREKLLLGLGFGIRPNIPWGWINAGVRTINIQGQQPSPTLEAIIGLGIHTR